MGDTSKSVLEGKPKLQAFIDHCCCDDHYKPFVDVYGTRTTEDNHPSLIHRRKVKALTYSPSEQHARIIILAFSVMSVISGTCYSLSLLSENMLNLKRLWQTCPHFARMYDD